MTDVPDELVARLREVPHARDCDYYDDRCVCVQAIANAAADRICIMKAQLNDLRAERDALREALRELVYCKDLKDRIDANYGKAVTHEIANLAADYECRKPWAWRAARAALQDERHE